MTDHFYRIRTSFGRSMNCHNYTYYRSKMHLSPANVVKYAVRDGMLLDVFAPSVTEVVEITPEEYFEHMWE